MVWLVKFVADPIPEGSFSIAVFFDDDKIGIDPIRTVMTLENLGRRQCRIVKALGVLSNDINEQIGLFVLEELEFDYLIFSTVKGSSRSRHAAYLYSDGVLDWFGADLIGFKQSLGLR